MRPAHNLLILCTLASLQFGCQRSDSNFGTSTPSGSSVQIVFVSPPVNTELVVGEKVKLKVDVKYALTGDSGTLGLVVQSSDNSSVAQNFEVVNKGSGQSSLEAEFVIPQTKVIQIFTPLSAQGQNSTSTVDSRAFKVVSK